MRMLAAIFLEILLTGLPLPGTEPVQEVPAADIGVNTDIIGLLGLPLGEMMTVTATYDPDRHPGGRRDWKRNLHVIRVTRVNGRDLLEPVEIVSSTRSVGVADDDFPTGKAFECRGCEMGGFENTSEEFLEENEKVGQSFQVAGAFGFYTRFLLVKAPGPEAASSAGEQEKPLVAMEARKQVQAADIGKKTVILGKLGAPIGHVVTMTVTLDPARQPKPTEVPENESPEQEVDRLRIWIPYVLQIIKVDHKDLTSPVEMNAFHLPWDPHPGYPTGQPFEVRGCESGRAEPVSEAFSQEYSAAGRGEIAEKGPLRLITTVTLLNSPQK